jgi:hypothetical protein
MLDKEREHFIFHRFDENGFKPFEGSFFSKGMTEDQITFQAEGGDDLSYVAIVCHSKKFHAKAQRYQSTQIKFILCALASFAPLRETKIPA